MSDILDLFCGCGGLSLSAKMAGFNVIGSVDIDKDLTSKYQTNFPDSNLILADVAEIKGSDLVKKLGKKPTGIIGGPPCQGFSLIGKRDKHDPRNELLYHFFRLVDEIQPDFFIMENVPGLLSSESSHLLDEGLDLISNKYNVAVRDIFNAADFGAATKRRRLVVSGYNPKYVDTPNLWVKRKSVSVEEAISDLPKLDNLESDDEGNVYGKYNGEPSSYARKLRTIPKGIKKSSHLERLKEGFVSGCNTTNHTDAVRKRFGLLAGGESDPISRYVKLKADEPSITLRAGTGKDKGSYQAARPIHPYENRVITVREAARIQGFPDWFVFHPTIWHSFRMIGNSVSPMLGKTVLESYSDKIEKS